MHYVDSKSAAFTTSCMVGSRLLPNLFVAFITMDVEVPLGVLQLSGDLAIEQNRTSSIARRPRFAAIVADAKQHAAAAQQSK
jgi:hypothetical protein